MKNSQQHLGNEANVTLRKNSNLGFQATFSLSNVVIFLMVSPLLGRFLVSFHLQSAVCGLQSAVCKCHTPLQNIFLKTAMMGEVTYPVARVTKTSKREMQKQRKRLRYTTVEDSIILQQKLAKTLLTS